MNRRALLTSAVAAFVAVASPRWTAYSHEGENFSAGEPGNTKAPSRIVLITMQDSDGNMRFIPNKLDVKKGEQIKFVIRNGGVIAHEFVLATAAENLEHAKLMQKYPDMEHDDPNAIRLAPGKTGEIVWKFTKAGAFEFSCLIPGHREAGMIGHVIVK
ncbi:MAG: cupredoxin family protein [Pseudolabrys sp.]|nr:cupredoxin family protein [Pseudolabrys sp.]